MVDVLTLEQRSYNMSRIRAKNTAPEMAVRRLLRSLGYAGRYRINVRTLSGCPNIVLPKGRAVIFVHGCYWHIQECPLGVVRPKMNEEFWQQKRLGNVKQDKRSLRKLRKEWSVLTVWECQTRDENRLSKKLSQFLSAFTAS